jgi:hypothetical protein
MSACKPVRSLILARSLDLLAEDRYLLEAVGISDAFHAVAELAQLLHVAGAHATL